MRTWDIFYWVCYHVLCICKFNTTNVCLSCLSPVYQPTVTTAATPLDLIKSENKS